MEINLENAESVVGFIAMDLWRGKNAFFDDWLNQSGRRRPAYKVSGWEFVEGLTTYEGSPAREITVLWDSERRNEEPMAIIVVAKKPKDWAKGYVYLTNGRLKDYNGKQVIVIFRIKTKDNETRVEKSMHKETDYDKVQAMLENEERKQITLPPQSINKAVIS